MSSPMPEIPEMPEFNWPTDAGGMLDAEFIGGGTIDDLARAASEHGIMITISFIPATVEDEDTDD